jgi:hypothetical protein
MALYELRTYTLSVGAMAEAVKLYQEIGFPALQKGGHDKKLVGYFLADTGTINQLLHLWKFDDDGDRLSDCGRQPELTTSINTVFVRVRKIRTTKAAAAPQPYRD